MIVHTCVKSAAVWRATVRSELDLSHISCKPPTSQIEGKMQQTGR